MWHELVQAGQRIQRQQANDYRYRHAPLHE
jgi:hypothetical protein